ncbi:RDD family protein [Salinimicrobium gaetbulicola]|uniref:RDD family protein n=1 Tax=Salinimicrobium gaetbulicola TaxID=999702 RepID=A0ABW3IHI2_9FLAO
MKNNRVFNYELASKGDRLFAAITQGVLLFILLIIVYKFIGIPIAAIFSSDTDLIDILISILQGLFLGAIFYPFFTGNLGHKIFGLKVISAETGEDYKKADEGAIRECLKNLLGYLIIPNIWILWDKKNQNLYDKLTNTYVVKRFD